ncbi:unnamed protein product [Vicia faba]|uniref:Uncharacterized protein n=1 Tax=Vicia faba TaxID=3906 RepID=A0AAV1ACX9_VICFA|nr:unnamed protein product [Vicia faba]
MYVRDIALCNIPHGDKSDLAAGGNVIDVPVMYGSMRNYHPIQKYFESQIHKENGALTHENNSVSDDDLVCEDVKANTVVTHVGVVMRHYDVPDNMYDMLMTEFPTQRKDDQVSIVNSKLHNSFRGYGIFLLLRHYRYSFLEVINNISFNFETSGQKWKYVVERRIDDEREIGKEALDCKDIMELLKIITNVGPSYDTLIKEFIVNISNEYNVRGIKEYNNMYDRGKSEEEEEIASEDEEEHFVEALDYNVSMELYSDSQLLKIMLKAGGCYPRLLKEIEVKNDGIPHGLLSSVIRCWLGKMSQKLCITSVY